jgi:hypothetical protein
MSAMMFCPPDEPGGLGATKPPASRSRASQLVWDQASRPVELDLLEKGV